MDDFIGDILIVDDNTANLQTLSAILKERKHKVRAVTTGQMALIVAHTATPELILLDVNMPEMNGYEVCQRLKTDPALHHIPVVFISALDETLDKIKAFRVGGVDYITKPFQIEEVLVRVENHLKLYRLYQQSQEMAALEERQRIARDLHDAVNQTLFSASMMAETLLLTADSDPAKIKPGLERIHQLTQGALAEMRTLLFELRPDALMNADLATLLPYLVDSAIARTKAHVEFSLDGDVELTPEAKVVFYRIAQEALNNIVKHAHATEIAIGIYQTATEVVMRIADDGVGFDAGQLPPGHFGLGIMQERAHMIGAELEVDTAPEQGTTIVLHWKRQH
ncbi:MAG: response regulator [Anaerolineae bacterium]|nr:response regulator [Anaerolineae bacterium]